MTEEDVAVGKKRKAAAELEGEAVKKLQTKTKEELMEEDIKERDALSKRMLEREKEKSKPKKMRMIKNPQLSQITMTKEERAEIVKAAKRKSRHIYLPERTDKQMMLKKKELEENRQLFGDNISKAEVDIRNYNEKIYDLALKQTTKKADDEKYQLPANYQDEEGRLDMKKK